MDHLLAILIAALAGLHVSTWGMYKDGPHEGFRWATYARSTLVAIAIGAAAYPFLGWDLSGDLGLRIVFFGLVYCLERGATEFWKYFVREEDQAKYFIPMQFGILGKPMKDAPRRIAIGVAVAAACAGVFFGLAALDARCDWPDWLVVLTVGSAFGWISAFGGAWKDAPIEGFETFKFFRSPGVAAAWATVVIQFTDSWPVIALAAEGFTVASIETYKKFGHPEKPPGKFAGKPIIAPEHFRFRRPFAHVFFAIWTCLLLHLVLVTFA
ncbi:MAG: hypothetical protein F9K40_05900 [Kofleriaceae bacterium]|nr:MAG: hypothetical protein F9K40_05900 [Kofleriaceae bacterium]MBZ0233624.1 hypothetical protein [Kofleriaceae bacterium]